MKRLGVLVPWFASLALAAAAAAQNTGGSGSLAQAAGVAARVQPAAGPALDLQACLALAAKNSTRGKVAASSIDAAVARQGQARSSRYPELTATLSASRFDQDPNFIFPASTIAVPASSMPIPPMLMMLPANSFGPGVPPVTVPLQVPGSTLAIPAQTMQVPLQNVKLMDRNLLAGGLEAMFPLYTGGLAGARIAQAQAGVAAARHEQRRTELEIAYDVTRAYYGVVLARQVAGLARDTLTRMEATLQLTESLYKNGSGRVKKTDYLRNKSMVETIRAMVAAADGEEQSARAALETAVEWDGPAPIEVADKEIPFTAGDTDLAAILSRAQASNPDIGRLTAGIAAARAGVDAAASGHLPKVGLFANLKAFGNSYEGGVMTPDNKMTFAVGVGVELPIFQGFRVAHAVGEAKAELQARQQQLELLRDGVALEIQRVCYHLQQAQLQQQASREAYRAASENRDLNERAYQEELVETKDVIEAQLMEALLAAQHYKVLYDAVEARAHLEFVVGQAVRR